MSGMRKTWEKGERTIYSEVLATKSIFVAQYEPYSVQYDCGGTDVAPNLIPRPSPAQFSWPHTWPLNCSEKREKAWYIFYVKMDSIMTYVESVSEIMATMMYM